ncbi:MAG: MFS transporter [Actinomycetota bacterium]|nr:MFS transporter [Actinomycetota bacterium]
MRRRLDVKGWVVLWLLGLSLRITVLALAPLLPVVTRDLRLDQTAIGAVTNLPVLLFGLGAAIGSAVIRRVGTKHAVVLGLLMETAGGALRGAGTSTAVLFGCTFVMGLGIAILQPALPALVRRWKPSTVGTATAVYGNGLLIGEAIAASLTLPVVLEATGSWQESLALWSAPVALTLVLVALVIGRDAPHPAPSHPAPSHATESHAAPAPGQASTAVPTDPRPGGASAWSRLRAGGSWKLGLVQGGASTAYFAANAFLPGVLHATGHGGQVGEALTVLNVSQLPASAVLLVHADRLARHRWPLWTASAALVGISAGLLVASPPVLLVLAGLLGFSSGFLLLLALALPAAAARERDVAPISAAMFTIGYTMAFVLPLAGGVVSDATGSLRITLAPGLLGAVLAVIASATITPNRSPKLERGGASWLAAPAGPAASDGTAED